jgi:hypothetical protein
MGIESTTMTTENYPLSAANFITTLLLLLLLCVANTTAAASVDLDHAAAAALRESPQVPLKQISLIVIKIQKSLHSFLFGFTERVTFLTCLCAWCAREGKLILFIMLNFSSYGRRGFGWCVL